MTLTVGFGVVLKNLRRTAGLSQEALAERAAISTQAVSALECGLRKSPYPKTVALLASALGLNETARAELEWAAAASRAARDAASAGRPAGDDGHGRLPAALTELVGRSSDVAQLHSLLRTCRLVTVLGLGGIGKTSLAIEAARSVQYRYADGAYFCDLSALGDGALVASAIASTRGVSLRRDEEPTRALGAALKSSDMLLVLDNCEHVVEAAAAIASELLRACPNVSILATSRRRLGSASEATFLVPSLATPSDVALDGLSARAAQDFAAVALFVQRATAVSPQFLLTDENAPDAARICRHLDGIALAIELAAAQARVMTVSELARRLDQRFRLLGIERRDDAPRQRTLRSAFDWSYALLSDGEQGFFRALAIFAGTFTLDAALEVCCDPGADELHALELLAALVDASLLVADTRGDATRYRFLETTHAYAAEKIAQSGELPTLSARHLAYYRAHAAQIALGADLEDVRAALRWALDSGDPSAGADIAATIGVQWEQFGLSGEGIARLEAFIAAVPARETRLVARLWTALSFLRGNALEFAKAFEAARIATDISRGIGDEAVAFNALRSYAIFAAWQRRFDDAASALGEAAAIAEHSPTPLRTLHLWLARGHVARHSGNFQDAAAAFVAARSLARELDDGYREVSAAVNLGEVLHEGGETERAVEILRGLRAEGELQRVDVEPVLANLVGYLIALDDLPGARAAAREMFALRGQQHASSTFVTAALEHLALAAALAGESRSAAKLLGYCDAWYDNVGHARHFTEQRTHERLVALLDRDLTPHERARLANEGAELTPERAIRESLDRPGDGRDPLT